MYRGLCVALWIVTAGFPAAAADGAKLFQLQCKGCHTEPPSSSAPTLHGVFGAKIAGNAAFKYSEGLAAKQGTWDAAHLDEFLKAPDDFAPGTLMPTPAGLTGPADRAAIIAYLKSLK